MLMNGRKIYRRTIMVKRWHPGNEFTTVSYGRWRAEEDDCGNHWLVKVGGKNDGKILYVFGPVIEPEYGEVIGFDCWNYQDERF